MSSNPYNEHLDKNPANYQPLTPLQFLARAAAVYPEHTAVIHGNAAHELRASSMRAAAVSPRRSSSAASAPATPSR